MRLFRVVVTGGRYFLDRESVFTELDALLVDHDEVSIIHGACCDPDEPTRVIGADRWAQEWAMSRQQNYAGFPAKWGLYGNPAGPIRNRLMARLQPDLVLAFPGGTGTDNMVQCAKDNSLPYRRVPERQS